MLGKNSNSNNNDWNHPWMQVCVHAFIGKLADGTIATYQTLPLNMRGWHAGGTANNTHISFEICEDGLTDPAYFSAVYREAIDLCVYLCKLYGLTEKNILCHSEGCKQGIASNHGDVMHWWSKHGKSMDTFCAEVKAELAKQDAPAPTLDNTPCKLVEGSRRVGAEGRLACQRRQKQPPAPQPCHPRTALRIPQAVS